MSDTQHSNDQRNRFRNNPVMWLVIGLPLLAVIFTVSMVVVATMEGSGHDSVAENVKRTGQIQTAELGPDEVARQQNLSAVLRNTGKVIEMYPVGDQMDRSAEYLLELLHPTQQKQDVKATLKPTDVGWRTEVSVDPEHDWNVRLSPANGEWRLVGRLVKGQHAVRLHPALPEDSEK